MEADDSCGRENPAVQALATDCPEDLECGLRAVFRSLALRAPTDECTVQAFQWMGRNLGDYTRPCDVPSELSIRLVFAEDDIDREGGNHWGRKYFSAVTLSKGRMGFYRHVFAVDDYDSWSEYEGMFYSDGSSVTTAEVDDFITDMNLGHFVQAEFHVSGSCIGIAPQAFPRGCMPEEETLEELKRCQKYFDRAVRLPEYGCNREARQLVLSGYDHGSLNLRMPILTLARLRWQEEVLDVVPEYYIDEEMTWFLRVCDDLDKMRWGECLVFLDCFGRLEDVDLETMEAERFSRLVCACIPPSRWEGLCESIPRGISESRSHLRVDYGMDDIVLDYEVEKCL